MVDMLGLGHTQLFSAQLLLVFKPLLHSLLERATVLGSDLWHHLMKNIIMQIATDRMLLKQAVRPLRTLLPSTGHASEGLRLDIEVRGRFHEDHHVAISMQAQFRGTTVVRGDQDLTSGSRARES